METWGEDLAGLTAEQIIEGLKRLPKDWPPSPMAFRDLCTGEASSGLTHNTAAYKVFDKSTLIEKKADVKVAKKACDKMRQILKGGK